jgi:hypothetical protein
MKNILRIFIEGVSALFRIFSDTQLSKSWWVRIQTGNPEYTYYFGPFERRAIAHQKLPGFIQDLRAESAHIIDSSVEWCNPPQLTIEGAHQPI